MFKTLTLLALATSTQAWVSSPVSSRTSSALAATKSDVSSRKEFMSTLVQTAMGAAVVSAMPLAARAEDDVTTLPNGVSYKVVKSGDGPKPDIGELAAIRFAAYANDFKIDDIFETPEPYYTRVGSGGLLKGVESVLPTMRVGDRWVLTVPVRTVLAFLASFGGAVVPGQSYFALQKVRF